MSQNNGNERDEMARNDAAETVAVEPARARKTWIQRYGFSMVLLALCLVMGYYIIAQQNKSESADLPYDKPGAEFSYLDTDGNTVTLSNTNGKVRLLYFFFATCPDVCPPTTAIMSQVQDELKKDGVFGSEVEFLSVTIDPTKDTTDNLKKYADQFGADTTGWKFLRGDEKATADLATNKYDILVNKDPDGNFGHMNFIALLDKEGHIRDYISANDYFDNGDENKSPKEMAKQIKSLL
ncbi:SCO family protein [Cohnella suwonensis]|uniref:SCO family protein n=1 Tax=Cohnella suwonensis TaxID=696072 RepID=A0ABW0LVZ5_9BACL